MNSKGSTNTSRTIPINLIKNLWR